MIPSSEATKIILFVGAMLALWTFAAIKLEAVEARQTVLARV